ncbi:hypothetical protein [Hymenobacter sp. CRA2]|uniref:hypothetical protein n=1 Tax=Hymenobacter sp. CRA2 TaxID=1955620 RepID=UPI0009901FCF|nr:hypothetical protein [Hymenobacter sp. CRA2]OON69422.1 hypothetical protein B0919_09095 [Hymenobacter sp. CRA2]
MRPPIQLDPHTGHLQLGPSACITDTTTPADLPHLFPGATITPTNLGNGWQHYHVRLEPADWLVVVVLTFIGRYLIQWQLVFTQDTAPKQNWANWNEEAERQQAIRYQQWLTTQLGPEQRQFDWGEVWVGYDARSGSSSIMARYGGPEPTPRPA